MENMIKDVYTYMWNQHDRSCNLFRYVIQRMQIAHGVSKNNVILQSGEQLWVMF